MIENCIDCGHPLVYFKQLDDFTHKGITLQTEVEYSLCFFCNTEVILPFQIKNNDRYFLNAISNYEEKNDLS
jgi:hypothetical protein